MPSGRPSTSCSPRSPAAASARSASTRTATRSSSTARLTPPAPSGDASDGSWGFLERRVPRRRRAPAPSRTRRRCRTCSRRPSADASSAARSDPKPVYAWTVNGREVRLGVATTAFDVEAVRARYSALRQPLAFFDGAGRDAGARTRSSTPWPRTTGVERELRRRRSRTSRATDALVDERPARGRRLPRLRPRRGRLRREHDDAELRPHAGARPASSRPGDEILVTKLDHDANVVALAPARATTSACASSSSTSTTTRRSTSTTCARRLSARTRVVAFPWASNAVGTVQDVAADRRARARGGRARLGRRRPLRAARPDRRRGRRRGRAALLAVQVLRAAPRARVRSARAARALAAVQGAARAGVAAGRATRPGRRHSSCSPASSPPSTTSARSAGTRSRRTSGRSGERFLDGLPERCTLHGLPTMDGRVPTFALSSTGLRARGGRDRARRARLRGLARRLLRRRDHAPARPRARRRRPRRDRPLQHGRRGRPAPRGARVAVRLLVLGGTKFLGRAIVEEALARGHEVTTFTRGRDEPRASSRRPSGSAATATATSPRSRAARGTPCSTPPATSRASCAPRPSCSASSGFYVFVSSISVYAAPLPPGYDETTPRARSSRTADGGRPGGLRRAQGRVRAGRRGGLRRPGRAAPVRAHRRPARPDRPLHLLARPASRAAATCSAPGAPDRPWQFVDVRDGAAFALDVAERRFVGPFNVTNSSTAGEVLAGAAVTWVDDAFLSSSRASASGWSCRSGSRRTARSARSTRRTRPGRAAAGLRMRPVAETVADTQAWSAARTEPGPGTAAMGGTEGVGLAPEKERDDPRRLARAVG